jgi:hypothetical protein
VLTLNNVATQDKYVEPLTLGPIPSAQKIVYLVANNAAIVQLAGHSDDKTIQPWGDELLLTPTTGEFQRIQGMRFRSAIAGAPAQIVAQLVEPGDPVPIGGTPFTAALSPSGTITPGNSSVQIQHNGGLVGTEPTIDFVDALGNVFTVTDDVPNTRVLVVPAPSPVRMLGNEGSVIAQNTVAETTLSSLQIPAGGLGVNGFARVTVQGLFLNQTGANQDWPNLRYWLTVVGVGSTLLLDTGSIAAGGGIISAGTFAAWKAVLELHNVGGTGFIDANMTLHGGSGGGGNLSGNFSSGFGQWLSSGQMIHAEGNVQGIAADTSKPIQIVLNAINFVASPNYLISARYSQLEVCSF